MRKVSADIKKQSSDIVQKRSQFHNYRSKHNPRLPKILQEPNLKFKTFSVPLKEQKIKELFPSLNEKNPEGIVWEACESTLKVEKPINIGVALAGGPAPGGSNVILGLYDFIKKSSQQSILYGFVDGIRGIYDFKVKVIDENDMSFHKNRGGFDLLKTCPYRVDKEETFKACLDTCEKLNLDGLVIVGGDDSNTRSALLAEYFKKHNSKIRVVGCPKTIDGDLKNEHIEVSFGFDTACKTYAQQIGNIMMDTLSDQKLYHFIKLMGRNASHITVECALLTRPNYVYVGEEVQEKKQKLGELVDDLVQMIVKRSEIGKDYGVVLVPEGLIDFAVDVGELIKEINRHFATTFKDVALPPDMVFDKICGVLSEESVKLLRYLPAEIRNQFLCERDAGGQVQLTKIETEKLLILLCQKQLEELKAEGKYKGKFKPESMYLGYEGRCAFPTEFDADYCYSLGFNAAMLIDKGFTGLISSIKNLKEEPDKWQPGGFPLVSMMWLEEREAKIVPVIQKALVDLKGPLFQILQSQRQKWKIEDHYRSIGPVQYETQYQCPYLVQPPQQLYQNVQCIHHDPKQQPFSNICIKDMSDLALQRIAQKCELPKMFEGDYSMKKKKRQIFFKNDNVRDKAKETYGDLYKSSIKYLMMKRPEGTEEITSNRKNLNIGICFNGHQSPGQLNIIEGLIEFCKKSSSKLFGFIQGTKGLFNCNVITDFSIMSIYINQGAQIFLGRDRDSIRTEQEFEIAKKTCDTLDLDGLIFVGGMNTVNDILKLSNYFANQKSKTSVIVVPCMMGNSLGHPLIESVPGFDTASKDFSNLVGNLLIDAASGAKYTYFIKIRDRYGSHLVLESALQTQTNITLVNEEIQSKGWTFEKVVKHVADLIELRHKHGKDFGAVLLSESLLSVIPEFKQLLDELNQQFKKKTKLEQESAINILLNQKQFIKEMLSYYSANLFLSLPDYLQKQLVLERNASGSLQNSKLNIEKFIAEEVANEIKRRKYIEFRPSSKNEEELIQSITKASSFFKYVCFQLGYQGRSAIPTIFDCRLAKANGFLGGVLVQAKLQGYCTTIKKVNQNVKEWEGGAVPLLIMVDVDQNQGKLHIPYQKIDVNGDLFKRFSEEREKWILEDFYKNPGPIQYSNDMKDIQNITFKINSERMQKRLKMLRQVKELQKYLKKFTTVGIHEDLLQMSIDHLKNLVNTLQAIKYKYE